MDNTKKILTVVGARPQFIKAAPLSFALRRRRGITEAILHTGQHYDPELSDVFFEQMRIPRPDHSLDAGSGTHGAQTAAILKGVEDLLLAERPDWVVVFGDTNSTLAGALAAAKLQIPVAHVEAGMRSFNRAMPEELNRVVTDHLATLHLCASATAVRNLAAEGVTSGVREVGDIMLDAVQVFAPQAAESVDLERRFGVEEGSFLLLTCHRAENTDDPARLREIIAGADAASRHAPVLFPAHPRVRAALEREGIALPSGVRMIPPVGYLEMLALIQGSRLVLTDSGGLQKEALYLKRPCVTMRDETEWVETVESGWNILTGADAVAIGAAAGHMLEAPDALPPHPGMLYGDGRTAERIADLLAAGPEAAGE